MQLQYRQLSCTCLTHGSTWAVPMYICTCHQIGKAPPDCQMRNKITCSAGMAGACGAHTRSDHISAPGLFTSPSHVLMHIVSQHTGMLSLPGLLPCCARCAHACTCAQHAENMHSNTQKTSCCWPLHPPRDTPHAWLNFYGLCHATPGVAWHHTSCIYGLGWG